VISVKYPQDRRTVRVHIFVMSTLPLNPLSSDCSETESAYRGIPLADRQELNASIWATYRGRQAINLDIMPSPDHPNGTDSQGERGASLQIEPPRDPRDDISPTRSRKSVPAKSTSLNVIDFDGLSWPSESCLVSRDIGWR
jgi:hypothetical protein